MVLWLPCSRIHRCAITPPMQISHFAYAACGPRCRGGFAMRCFSCGPGGWRDTRMLSCHSMRFPPAFRRCGRLAVLVNHWLCGLLVITRGRWPYRQGRRTYYSMNFRSLQKVGAFDDLMRSSVVSHDKPRPLLCHLSTSQASWPHGEYRQNAFM